MDIDGRRYIIWSSVTLHIFTYIHVKAYFLLAEKAPVVDSNQALFGPSEEEEHVNNQHVL